ncbi:sulfurtransferase [Solimicrobium silvestre]|uniref:Sulfurtransferase n=1 Tax=Solimicrobium silvestre TaxID=2099400 RepID=A0A2S9GV18_9BURK|nr:sulfurtransferase [Solimicrobium silvestre]PRC91548.1 Rhodanese-related sulfurtransferase [Solimicrobium silvestre]
MGSNLATFTTLISVNELAQHSKQPNWIILDCRNDLANPDAGPAAFAQGHIPTAQFVHLDQDLSDHKRNANGVFFGRHPLPERAAFIAKLRAWGISNDTQVLAYDAHGGMYAARLWWMLRWVGHAAVAVLDGGLPAWVEANQPLDTQIFEAAPGAISEQTALVSLVSVNDVVVNIETRHKTVVDARSPDRYRGENETIDPVGGHIPGAKNRFFKDNLQVNGRFKSAQELRAELGAVIKEPHNAIMQCGSGVTACHNLLALEIAGMPGAALYAGSWSEWCSDPARPIALGTN